MVKPKNGKRKTKKLIFFLLLFGGILVYSLDSAEAAPNAGVSDATIVVKEPPIKEPPKEDKKADEKWNDTSSATTKNPVTGMKKILPQTADNQQQSQLLVSLGSVLLLALASVQIIKRKKEKNYE